MKSYSTTDIESWERFYRSNFINSLTGFKSVSLIATVNKQGQPNLGIFSSIVHIGSNPALVGYINRPLKSAPHTIANIQATGIYTINHIDASFVEQAHQTSAKYDITINEFEAVGLTPEYHPGIAAPFVKESRIKYALEFQQAVPIELNDTILVIGKIVSVVIDETIISEDGFLNADEAGSVSSNGIDRYYSTSKIARFTYAKPGKEPEKLDQR